jgi:hypothetical protein
VSYGKFNKLKKLAFFLKYIKLHMYFNIKLNIMTTQFMTNIDTYLYNFLDSESKKTKKTKREILEKIITEYIENKKKSELENAYKNM